MRNSDQNSGISNDQKLSNLREQLRFTRGTADDAKLDDLLNQIRSLEATIKKENKIAVLKRVNKQQAEHRAIITDLLALEFPTEDITTNDGNFHAVKIKKHPSIVEFMTKHPYARFKFEKGLYKSCSIGRDDYNLGKTIYNYGKEDEFKKFETLSEVCQWHGFLEKEMTFSEFTKLETAILKESQRIKAEIKKSEEKIRSLNSHFLNRNNLIRRFDLRAEEYLSI